MILFVQRIKAITQPFSVRQVTGVKEKHHILQEKEVYSRVYKTNVCLAKSLILVRPNK